MLAVGGDGEETLRIKLVSSDSWSTQELMERLSALPEVVIAEPDYYVNLADRTPDEWAVTGEQDRTPDEGTVTGEQDWKEMDLTPYQDAFGNGP